MKPNRNVIKDMHFFFAAILFPLIFAGPFSAIAGSDFRCSGRIIEVRQTRDYVRQKCGPPNNIEERTENLARAFNHSYPENHEGYNYIINENKIEVWTYNLGPTQFVRYLTFRNGALIDIRTGGYGY